MTSYSRIKRGSMGGDHYTQIRNALFRDTRLSAKAMGVFGNLSTHTDGYGITVAMIARQMSTGEAGVKAALRELEKFGYLVREQEHFEGGSWGGNVYFVTDDPAASIHEDMPRSEPLVENRLAAVTSGNTGVDEDHAAKPQDGSDNRRSEALGDFTPALNAPAPNEPTKKTSFKKTNLFSSVEEENQAGRARRREPGGGASAACLPAEASPGEQLLRSLPPALATAQVIRQHTSEVSALIAAGWPPHALHKHLSAECDGNSGPGRLVTAIRQTPATYTPRTTALQPGLNAEPRSGHPRPFTPPPPVTAPSRAAFDALPPQLQTHLPTRLRGHAQ